jgi:hypothetical protein
MSVWQLFPDVGVAQLLDTDEPVTGWFLVSNGDVSQKWLPRSFSGL